MKVVVCCLCFVSGSDYLSLGDNYYVAPELWYFGKERIKGFVVKEARSRKTSQIFAAIFWGIVLKRVSKL
ncbi:MAG: hypothetical protein M1497_07895 [Nitrospirae bacterium]|nr:hypothetical protein [Nitrospirota bacterium]